MGNIFREFSDLYTTLTFKRNSLKQLKSKILKKKNSLEMVCTPSKLIALPSRVLSRHFRRVRTNPNYMKFKFPRELAIVKFKNREQFIQKRSRHTVKRGD